MLHTRTVRRSALRFSGVLSLITPHLGAHAASVGGAPSEFAELSLEQLMEVRIEKVFSASRYEQKVTRAPASVTILSADEIEKFGHRTLADVVRSARGLYVSNDGNYSYFGARGFQRPGDYNTRVLVLVDGHRMNDNVYDAAYVGRESAIDIDLVDRVELVRGPGSSIYGTSAFFGTINVVTKRGAQLEGGLVSAEIGNLDTYKGSVTTGGVTRRGVDWILSASRYSSGGRKGIYFPEFDPRVSANPAAANEGVAEDWDGEKTDHVFTRISQGDFTLSGFLTRRNKEVPTATFGTIFNDRREQTTDTRVFIDAKYDRAISPDVQLLGRVFYDSYRYAGDYPYDYAGTGNPADFVLNRDFAHGEWAGTEWQLNARLASRHLLIVGGEFRENFHQDQFNYDLEPYYEGIQAHDSSRTLGVYAQIEAALTADLVLNAGVRHDRYFDGFGGTTNPRFGLIYNPWQGTTLKALHGQAFRAPNSYERRYFSSQPLMPALRPETIRTGELVWEQYLGRYHRFSVSGYRYEVDSLISQSLAPATGAMVFENREGARSTGAEFEFESRWDGGTTARISYARQRSKDTTTGLELTSSPRNLAKLNVSVPFARQRIFVGLEGQYHGSVATLGGRRAGDFALVNATLLARQWRRGWDVSVSAYNLFDRRYYYPGAEDHAQDLLPQEGRSVRIKLTHRF